MFADSRAYGREYDFPAWSGRPLRNIIIAALPRTGSTLLSALMWRTAVLGAPLEYLNFGMHKGRLGVFNDDINAYWRSLWRRRTSPNGVFSWKIFIKNYDDIAKNYTSFLSELSADEVIFLDRRDKDAHALSYWRAITTQSWFKEVAEQIPIEFDPRGIDQARILADNQRVAWENIFSITSTRPLRVFYEDLIERPGAVDLICASLGEKPDYSGLRAHIELPAVQRDSLSAAWLAEYRAYKLADIVS